MMTRLIVGFAGLIGSGKTTAALELNRFGFTRMRFAGPLKKMMGALGLTPEEIDGNLKELPSDLLCGSTPRWAMQSIGTEWGRKLIGEEVWVNAWKRAVSKMPAGAHVAVDDVRFPNEVKAIQDMGGVVVWIERRLRKVGEPMHESERLDPNMCDHVIENTGTDEQFLAKVNMLVVGLTSPVPEQEAA